MRYSLQKNEYFEATDGCNVQKFIDAFKNMAEGTGMET
jgi:hypothetical protein